MRINLVASFAEKDAVKALGARWDSAKKTWYIIDIQDLSPFQRWIPNSGTTLGTPADGANLQPTTALKAPIQQSKRPSTPKLANQVPHCGCDVLPWDHCIHTENS